jgi:hypothetical protein
MKIKELKRGILRFTGNYFLTFAINILCKTLKINLVNSESVEKLIKQKKNFVLAFWHNTMLLPWYIHSNSGFAALTSLSKDGDLLAKILRKWNYKVVRGSSSKGGDVALGIMVDHAKHGYSIAVTPDGPRGPVNKFKAGAVVAAKKSGVPIVLAGIGFRKKVLLKSWDKFQVPRFFSEAKLIYSDPIYIDQNLNYDQTSEKILECENLLNELQNRASIFN